MVVEPALDPSWKKYGCHWARNSITQVRLMSCRNRDETPDDYFVLDSSTYQLQYSVGL